MPIPNKHNNLISGRQASKDIKNNSSIAKYSPNSTISSKAVSSIQSTNPFHQSIFVGTIKWESSRETHDRLNTKYSNIYE